MNLKRGAVIAAVVAAVMVLFVFTVSATSVKPSLSKTKLKMYAGSTYKLKAKGFKGKVTWKSSNKKIAKVSKKGKITALKKGTVKITAKAGKVKKVCKVTVKPVKLNKKEMTVKKGQTFKLKLNCGSRSGIQWKTSSSAIVKIKSKSGNQVTLEALESGKTAITAVYKKKSYKCTVTVSKDGQPSDPTDPSKPTDPTDPTDPSSAVDPTDHSGHTDPSDPSQQDGSGDIELPAV